MNMLQASQMSNAELLQYKRHLQKYVFAGWEAPDDLKEWVRLLERHIAHSDLMEEEMLQTSKAQQQTGDTTAAKAATEGTGLMMDTFFDLTTDKSSTCQ